MGQTCGPLCGDDPVYGYDRRSNLTTSLPSNHNVHGVATTDEADRKLDQLEMELRMLRDDNFRIREEQMRLDREMKSMPHTGLPQGRGAGPGSAPGPASFSRQGPANRGDTEQQLSYMQDLIRSLQGENQKMRSQMQGGMGGGASQQEVVQLRHRLAQLQQAHLRQLSETRSMQSGAGTPLNPGRGSFGPTGIYTPGGSVDPNLVAQLQMLTAEQEALRSKVRKLAKN
eukprot:TRINITY_DN14336_c0_g1_i1.p2 TRINITY_DN14336_c0_g1~~TRINITY_DN14336_c0_g1_i1.p2  ORF type:complete len:251 (+),score=49.17 TRINITY_DN14336_c0_g1_i1:71-754(+)